MRTHAVWKWDQGGTSAVIPHWGGVVHLLHVTRVRPRPRYHQSTATLAQTAHTKEKDTPGFPEHINNGIDVCDAAERTEADEQDHDRAREDTAGYKCMKGKKDRVLYQCGGTLKRQCVGAPGASHQQSADFMTVDDREDFE